jgi:hypothetical protein
MAEAARTSETSVYFNETTRRYVAESCHLRVKVIIPCFNFYSFRFEIGKQGRELCIVGYVSASEIQYRLHGRLFQFKTIHITYVSNIYF